MCFSKQQSATDLHAVALNSGKLNAIVKFRASHYRGCFTLPVGTVTRNYFFVWNAPCSPFRKTALPLPVADTLCRQVHQLPRTSLYIPLCLHKIAQVDYIPLNSTSDIHTFSMGNAIEKVSNIRKQVVHVSARGHVRPPGP